MLSAYDVSDEDAINFDTDKYDRRKVKVFCPYCNGKSAPLCSSKTNQIDGGWRWVGCDHKEPYATFKTVCKHCKKEFMFTVYTPQ